MAYSRLYAFEQSPTIGDDENIAIVDWTLTVPTSVSYSRRLIWRRRGEVSKSVSLRWCYYR